MVSIFSADQLSFRDALATVEDRLRQDAPAECLLVDARPGAGKSTLLLAVQQRLGNRAVLLSPPSAAADVGEALLTSLADELRDRGFSSDRRAAISDPGRPFDEKLRFTLEALETIGEDLVVLCDGVGSWARSASEETQARANQIIAALSAASLTRVVLTTPLSGLWQPSAETLRLEPYRLGKAELEAVVSGSVDHHYVAETLDWLRDKTTLSPWVFRLLVLLHAVEAPARLLTTHALDLPRRALSFLDATPATAPLADAWRRLAIVRGSFERDIIDATLPIDLPPDLRALVEATLIEQAPTGQWRMPAPCRDAALNPPGNPPELGAAHGLLAGYYASRLNNGLAGYVRPALEHIHHTGLSANVDALRELPLMFPEQLHHIGWWLSTQYEDYAAAAEVFRLATQRNSSDAYAQHYLAFNLDLLGQEPDVVERSYTAALTLNPASTWWHSRWIRFLITRERIPEAHDAWHRARAELLPPDAGRESAPLYLELHRDVARWLLHSLEFDFAREVLEDVPPRIRARYPEFELLDEAVNRLEAVDPDAEYVPLWHATSGWSEQGPFLLRRELGPLGELRRWWTGRIERIDGDLVILSVAEVDRVGQWAPHDAEVTVAQLSRDSGQPDDVDVGRFVEVGFYGSGGSDSLVLAAIHPARDPSAGWLAPVFPRPRRYVSD